MGPIFIETSLALRIEYLKPFNKSLMDKHIQKSTDAWQILRIQSEFTRAFDELSDLDASISVFGSARTSVDDPLYTHAYIAGGLLAQSGFNVITGGGPGIMEAANKGAKWVDLGKKSIGVGIELPFEAGMNPGVQLGITCRYFFTRKVAFLKYSQGFIVFPGGLGTLDELFEALTLAQTGHAPKFPIVLVGVEYWSGLIEWIKKTVLAEGKMSEKDLDLFRIVDTGAEAVSKICEYHEKYRQHNITNF
jgi:uncharacterized protein (TIGR00730 family)